MKNIKLYVDVEGNQTNIFGFEHLGYSALLASETHFWARNSRILINVTGNIERDQRRINDFLNLCPYLHIIWKIIVTSPSEQCQSSIYEMKLL